MNNDCVFCDIVEGSSPGSVVWEDELAMAFLDLQPVRPGHTLLVPKVHAKSMDEMEVSTGSHLFGVSMRLAEAVSPLSWTICRRSRKRGPSISG